MTKSNERNEEQENEFQVLRCKLVIKFVDNGHVELSSTISLGLFYCGESVEL